MKLVGINNNKGFTLVEILAVLVLIGLLFGIGVPAVSKISKNMKARTYNQKINLIEEAGKLWGQDNKALLQSSRCDVDGDGTKESNCYKIKISELIDEDYLDSEDKNTKKFENPLTDGDMLNMCVYIYKKNNRIYSYYKGEDKLSGADNCINPS